MQKCLEIKIKALPLHPQSETNTLLSAAKRRFLKIFWKKFPKDLEVQKIVLTFALAFASKTAKSWKRFLEKFFEKSFQKIWWFKKFALPLHHFPLRNYEARKWTKNGSLIYWFYNWEKSVVFICQFPFRKNWNSQDSNKTF